MVEPYGNLSDGQIKIIDKICQSFEVAIRHDGSPPPIEPILGQAPPAIRDHLLRNLLAIECESRIQGGESPSAEELARRFPDRQHVVSDVWAEIEQKTRLDTNDRPGGRREPNSEAGSGHIETAIRPGSDDAVSSKQPTVGRPATETAGSMVGPYRLLQRIGQGGMGTVWMAEQQQPIRRTVAVKIIKAGMDTHEVIARFEAERQALAIMNHPNIAKVLDTGATDSGRPFFVMELVKGVPITEFCDKHQLAPEKRLALFVSVCHAVQHAHQKGIIHRDIKPSNVLVTLQDDAPVAKVIDFGLAKAIAQKLTEKTLFTALGQMVGTPAYMSPEQAEMSGLDVDTRTDVYSLGVLLYELLTGVTPINARELRSAGYAEMQRMICELDPPRMSTRISTLGDNSQIAATNRASDLKRLTNLLRGDLDLVVMKALEKDRSRRYDTPSSFAADIDRFLHSEAIEARPASAGYRIRKLIRRNKTAVVTTAIVAVALLLGTVVSVWQAVRATRALSAERAANEVARKRLTQLENSTVILASIFRDLDPSEEKRGGLPVLAQLGQRLDQATTMLDADAVGDPLTVANLQLTLGKTQRKLSEYAKAQSLVEKALAAREASLGPHHTDTLEAVAALGQVHSAAGNFDEAIPYLKRAYDQRLDTLGSDHPDTLKSLSILAATYGSAGQRQKGIELQERAYEATEGKLGAEHTDTVDCLRRLALQTWEYGEDDQKAEQLHVELLQRSKQHYGPKHHLTHAAAGSLASLYLSLGEYEQSVTLYERTIAEVREKVGPDHTMSIRLAGSLGFAYQKAGQVSKGLQILTDNVNRLKRKLGEDHPTTMNFLNLLAYSYEQDDQLDEAISLHDETYRLREKNLGPHHQSTLTSLSNLSWSYRRNGQFAESVEGYRNAVAGWKSVFDVDHPEVLGCMNNFAWALYQGGEFIEAEEVLDECLPLLQQHYPGGWPTVRATYWMGAALLSQNKFDDAEPMLLSAHRGVLARDGRIPDDSTVPQEILQSLIELYTCRNTIGDPERAAAWADVLNAGLPRAE